MIFVAAFQIEGEAAFGDLAQGKFCADWKSVQQRSEFASGDKFYEELKVGFVGRRNYGVSALDKFLRSLHTECGELPGRKIELAAGIETNLPKARGKFISMTD